LVLTYSEFGSNFHVDTDIHKQSVFYRQHNLNGLLEDFVDKLNSNLEPAKDQMQNLDRFSFLFLIIAFFATTIMGTIIGYIFSKQISIGLAAIYLGTLGFMFYRNNK